MLKSALHCWRFGGARSDGQESGAGASKWYLFHVMQQHWSSSSKKKHIFLAFAKDMPTSAGRDLCVVNEIKSILTESPLYFYIYIFFSTRFQTLRNSFSISIFLRSREPEMMYPTSHYRHMWLSIVKSHARAHKTRCPFFLHVINRFERRWKWNGWDFQPASIVICCGSIIKINKLFVCKFTIFFRLYTSFFSRIFLCHLLSL